MGTFSPLPWVVDSNLNLQMSFPLKGKLLNHNCSCLLVQVHTSQNIHCTEVIQQQQNKSLFLNAGRTDLELFLKKYITEKIQRHMFTLNFHRHPRIIFTEGSWVKNKFSDHSFKLINCIFSLYLQVAWLCNLMETQRSSCQALLFTYNLRNHWRVLRLSKKPGGSSFLTVLISALTYCNTPGSYYYPQAPTDRGKKMSPATQTWFQHSSSLFLYKQHSTTSAMIQETK